MRIDADISATRTELSRQDGSGWTTFLDDYELALRTVERDYPVLDPDAAEFREDVMHQVYETMKLLVKQGTSPALAVGLAAAQRLGH